MHYHEIGNRHEAFLAYCRDHGFASDEPIAALSFEDTMEQEQADYCDRLRQLGKC